VGHKWGKREKTGEYEGEMTALCWRATIRDKGQKRKLIGSRKRGERACGGKKKGVSNAANTVKKGKKKRCRRKKE